MKQIIYIVALSLLFSSIGYNSDVQKRYSGKRHTASHGGTYSSGKGSSHKGGTYKNSRTNNRYGRHK